MCIVLYLNRNAFQEWGNSRRGRPAAPIFERSWWCPRPWATEPAQRGITAHSRLHTVRLAAGPTAQSPLWRFTALVILAGWSVIH